MTAEKQLRPPLIVDPDLDFLNALKSDPLYSKVKPVVVATGREAQLLLCDTDQNYCGIFVNPKIAQPGGISVIRCSKLNRPAMPIYLLDDGGISYSESEIKQLGIEKTVQKPITLEQIMSLMGPTALLYNPQDKGGIHTDLSEKLGTELSEEDSRFTSIRAADFLSGTTCYFDVYVRINASKYVKILQAGDKFQLERIKSYLDKKVEFFYIKRETQEQYLSFCDQLSSSLVKREDVPVDIKLSQVMNHGEETLKFLRGYGINESNIQYSLKFLENVGTLVKTLNPGKQPLLKGFLNNITSYDHGVGVSTIASLLIPSLEIVSVGPIEAVGVGSLFHDIGLTRLGIETEDQSKMSPQELEKFKTHPLVGAEILSYVKGIGSNTIQAVTQHHERRNKRGFPSQVGAGSISMVAEIIGISDEFFLILEKMKEETKAGNKFDLQAEMKARIFDCFSLKIVNEFKKVFLFSSKQT